MQNRFSVRFAFIWLLFALPFFVSAQWIQKTAPTHWFTGMANPNFELIVYGEDMGSAKVSLDHPGIHLVKTEKAPNPNYLYLHLKTDDSAQPGTVEIKFKKGRKKETLSYEFKAKRNRERGIDGSDFIYLILPDRFANANPDNDDIEGTTQRGINRDSMFYRHGGDIKGIFSKMDYLEDLGATALWLNPVQANDQPFESYHGYAITDHYAIDPRLGTMDEYVQLVDELHKRDMKMVMDVVYNHCGNEHWLFQELPDSNFVHWYPKFTKTTYRAPTLLDPYAAEYDKNLFTNGWFDHHMPDLNQKDPHLAAYLIQNTIWWAEAGKLDAFRIDTYAYSDQQFMRDLVNALLKEYPDIGIFGETWVHGTPIQSWFTEGDRKTPSPLPGVTDFQLYYAINDALSQNFGWTEGMARLYYTLAKDYVYTQPEKNVVFLDNHDLSRFYSMVKEDIQKYKMGISWLMTTRGIPMMYYGTEILMKNYSDPDGKVREDFPGGWEGDPTDKFKKENLTAEERDAFDFVTNLANWRKKTPVMHSGKLMQFIPEKGIYVFFRYTETASVMVIMNQNKDAHSLETARFAERLNGYKKAYDVNEKVNLQSLDKIEVPGMTTMILELKR